MAMRLCLAAALVAVSIARPIAAPAQTLPSTTPADAGAVDAGSVEARATLGASPALDAESAKLLAQSIEELAADDFKTREKAQAAIANIGSDAEPALKEALQRTDDAETRSAIQTLLSGIAANREFGPTLIRLSKQDAPAVEVFDAIAAQAHVTFDQTTRAALITKAKPLSVDFNRVAFWPAMLEACRKAGMVFYSIDHGEITLDVDSDTDAPTIIAASDTFAMTLTRVDVNIRRSIDFGGAHGRIRRANGGNSAPYTFYLSAWYEPKLEAIRWSIDSVECTTDNGSQLTLRGAGNMAWRMSGASRARNETQLALFGNDVEAKSITKFKIKSKLTIAGEMEKVEVENPLTTKDKDVSASGFQVHIKNLTKFGNDRFMLSYTIASGSHDATTWTTFAELAAQYPVELFDAAGNEYSTMSSSTAGGAANQIEATRTFINRRGNVAIGEPAKLILQYPKTLNQIESTVEFKDIPLPLP